VGGGRGDDVSSTRSEWVGPAPKTSIHHHAATQHPASGASCARPHLVYWSVAGLATRVSPRRIKRSKLDQKTADGCACAGEIRHPLWRCIVRMHTVMCASCGRKGVVATQVQCRQSVAHAVPHCVGGGRKERAWPRQEPATSQQHTPVAVQQQAAASQQHAPRAVKRQAAAPAARPQSYSAAGSGLSSTPPELFSSRQRPLSSTPPELSRGRQRPQQHAPRAIQRQAAASAARPQSYSAAGSGLSAARPQSCPAAGSGFTAATAMTLVYMSHCRLHCSAAASPPC